VAVQKIELPIARELCEALEEILDEARWWAAQNDEEVNPSTDRRADQAIEDFKFELARKS